MGASLFLWPARYSSGITSLQRYASLLNTDRLLTQRRDAETVSQAFLRVVNIVVRDGRMGCDAVVPNGHCTIVPLHPNLNVRRVVDVLDRSVYAHVL